MDGDELLCEGYLQTEHRQVIAAGRLYGATRLITIYEDYVDRLTSRFTSSRWAVYPVISER